MMMMLRMMSQKIRSYLFHYSLPNCCRGSFYMYDATRTTCNQVMSPQFFTKKIYQKIPNLPGKLTDYLEFSEEVGDLETD